MHYAKLRKLSHISEIFLLYLIDKYNTVQDQKIKYFVSTELGKRLPFAITTYKELLGSNDIFTPSLRDFHVIFWVKKGKGSFFVDFSEYEFSEGTIILLSKDQLNYFLPFDTKQTEIISIGFKPEFIYKNDNDLEHLFKFNASAHQKEQQIIKIPQQSIEKLEGLCNEMLDIYTKWNKSYVSKGFYHCLCLFLIQCEMIQEDQNDKEDQEIDKNISDFLSFNELLEQYYKTEYKVEFYADQMNMTLKTLAKLTKTHYKISPKSVIDQRRILEIKRQLQGTSKPSKTIAYELNFGEPTNMFKFFKKHVGLTPKEFRSNK